MDGTIMFKLVVAFKSFSVFAIGLDVYETTSPNIAVEENSAVQNENSEMSRNINCCK